MAYTEGNAPIGAPGEDLQFTPKQVRNGTDIGAAGHNTAVAGPLPDMSGVTGSQAAAATYNDLGLVVWAGGDLDSSDMTVGEKSFGGGPSGV